jgi:hypothetical protein
LATPFRQIRLGFYENKKSRPRWDEIRSRGTTQFGFIAQEKAITHSAPVTRENVLSYLGQRSGSKRILGGHFIGFRYAGFHLSRLSVDSFHPLLIPVIESACVQFVI